MAENKNGEDTFRAVADEVVSEESPAHLQVGHVVRPTKDEILSRDVVAGVPVYVAEDLIRLTLDAPTSNKNVDNRVTSLLRNQVLEPYTRLWTCPKSWGA